MSDGQEITAGECDQYADSCESHGCSSEPAFRRAARTIRRLEEQVRFMEETRSGLVADAELGSLVRRIREHPEATLPDLTFTADGYQRSFELRGDGLTLALTFLDALAARRAGEEGERAPSGRFYRVRDGVLEVTPVQGFVFSKCACVVPEDLDVVERVRKGEG